VLSTINFYKKIEFYRPKMTPQNSIAELALGVGRQTFAGHWMFVVNKTASGVLAGSRKESLFCL